MFKLKTQIREGSVENFLKRESDGAGSGRLSFPDDVKDDVLKRGILVVTVSAPTVVANVHFDVTADGSGIAELDHGGAEIRATFDTRETGMKNSHALSVSGGQLIAAETLVLPDGL